MSPPAAPEASGQGPTLTFRLDQFLKWSGLVATGGEAKGWVQQGEVTVNGEIEGRRGRQVHSGDRVELRGVSAVVPGEPPSGGGGSVGSSAP